MSNLFPPVTTGFVPVPARIIAAIAEFMHHQGDGLDDLARAFDDPWFASDVETISLLIPDAQAPASGILDTAVRIRDYLEEVSTQRLQRGASTFSGADIFAAHRWYGARLHDLLA